MLYNPKAFFAHAAWLHPGLRPIVLIFPTASVGVWADVSVPVWLVILSDQLEIVALGEPFTHLLANPIWVTSDSMQGPRSLLWSCRHYAVLATVSSGYPLHRADPHTLLTRPPRQPEASSPATARLACVEPAASVQSEP